MGDWIPFAPSPTVYHLVAIVGGNKNIPKRKWTRKSDYFLFQRKKRTQGGVMGCECRDCDFSALVCLRHTTKNPKRKFVDEHDTCEHSHKANKWKDYIVGKE